MMKNIRLLSCFLLLFFTIPSIIKAQNTDEQYLFVGTYTRGASEGIYVYKFNINSGNFTKISTANIENPSFLAISPDQKTLYSVSENNENSSVSAFSFDKNTGILTQLNTQPSGGAHPCHLAIDKTGKWLFVGNYTGGNFSVLPINQDGQIGNISQTVQHEGSGVNKARQEKAHVHSVNIAPNNHDIFVADLGTDKINIYSFDKKTGQVSPSKIPFIKMASGAGPRHFTIHPNGKFAYVVQELNSTVTAFSYKKGLLKPLQTITTLPENYEQKSKNFCADIHISPDGRFLYGSNRFVDNSSGKNTFAPNNDLDTIVIYEINPKTGKLTYVGNESVKGKVPRNFMITPNGKFVLVANQETNNISIFERNAETGKLKYTGKEISVPTPVCLKMMRVE